MEAKRFLLVLWVMIILTANAEDTSKPSIPGKFALQDKMEALSDLDHEASRLKKKRAAERTKKAQGAVEYMETYKAKKASFAREAARLRDRIERDKTEIIKSTPSLKKSYERHKKHDTHVKETMKRALIAMRKVNLLVNGKQKSDPTVKMAQKAVAKSHGKEVFTVLGLDSDQLGKDYLLAMDAAVAAYDAKPSPMAEKRLERTIRTTKERMKKEAQLERTKKSEVRAKKERSAKNQVYYKTKWNEKTRELGRKRVQRDNLVKKLKKERKTKAWVRRKNEDEAEAKRMVIVKEKQAKKNKENAVKTRKMKVAQAKSKVKKNSKMKWSTAQKKLNDIVTSKKSDARKKQIDLKRVKEKMNKGKVAMERESKNVSAAGKSSAGAARAYGQAKEKKTKLASELNQKTATKAQTYMRARATLLRKSNFKEKAAKAKMKELGRKSAVAKLAFKAANAAKLKAIKKAALHKASKGTKKKKKYFSKRSSPRRVSRKKTTKRRL